MGTPTVTPEVLKFVADFQQALAPARLANTHANGAVLEAERQRLGLPVTVEAFVKIVKAILFENRLTWAVEPAQLKAQKANTAIQNKNVKPDVDAFAAKVKAGEAADAKAQQDAKYEKETASLIANYLPINSAGRIAYGAQASHQKRISDWVTASKARGVSAEAIFKAVQNEINRLYSVAEKSAERV